jgi:hypothetical protein
MPKRIIAATLLVTFAVASCRSWTPVHQKPDPLPESIRVELLSGERVELRDARAEGDTLVGRVVGTADTIRVPADQVVSMEAGRLAWGRSIVAVGGGVVLLLGAVVGAALLAWDSH